MVKDIDNVKDDGSPEDSVDEENGEPEIPLEEPSEAKKPQLSTEQMKMQQHIEGELGLARFLDYTINEPFELIYQDKLLEKYKNQLIKPLFGGNSEEETKDGRHLHLKQDYEELEIEEKYQSTIKEAEKIAKEEKGIKKPYLMNVKNFSMGIIGAVFVVFLILMALDKSGTVQQLYIPIALVMCFFPRIIQKIYLKKWVEIKEELENKLFESKKEDMEDIKIFIQYILDDIRERLLERKLPLQVINFMLLSQDYENVKIVSTQDMRNIKHYILQFKYPEGMQPFEVPDQVKEKMRMQAGALSPEEEDDNDEFIVLKNPVFNQEGELVEYEVMHPKPITVEGIEELLNDSEFIDVERPELVIPNFDSNEKIKCECQEPIQFETMKTSETVFQDQRLEFYLLIGKKCKCGKNPFVVFISPGVPQTPDELVDIFGEIKTSDN